MGVKSLMARLQSRAADTPDTSVKNTGYQCKAPIHGGCTPDTRDTPCFGDAPAIVQTGQPEQAANDPASLEPYVLENLTKLNIAPAANDLAQTVAMVSRQAVSSQTPVFTEPAEPPTDPNAWRELATAYHLHHFKCSTCIAAGRGAGYGLRCGTGAALWTSYQNT